MDVVRLVAEPHRREILRLIWNDERSAGHIASSFDVTFGAISQHLTILRRAGLVKVRKDGARRFYRTNRDALGPIAPMLEAMWARETVPSAGDRLDRS